jgi:hypothetical protein
MKYTSAEAAKLLRRLSEEHDMLTELERQSRTFVAAVSEDPESVRPKYDFAEVQAKLAELEGKIRRVKHALNIFNSTHLVPGFDMTIDQMLVYIPQLSQRKQKLREMAGVLPKTRVASRMMSGSGIIDYTYANYDVAAAEAAAAAASEELARAQTALDKVNTTETMEIEIP